MNPTDHPAMPEDAAQRVLEWLSQRDTMTGLDPEVIHRANRVPLNVSDLRTLLTLVTTNHDLTYELGQRKADCQKVRDLLVPVLAEHPLTKDDVDVTESGSVRAGYVAKLARQVIEHQGGENESEVQRLGRALESTQQALVRMEQARDELRIAIAQAAGIDLEKVSEIDVDFVREVRELGTEVKRLEGNEDFTTRVLHALLDCCDGRNDAYGVCDSDAMEKVFAAFREDRPIELPGVDVHAVLTERGREYAVQRDAESKGTHSIDNRYWEDMAEYQAKGLRLAQNAVTRDLLFALRRQIRAWKAEERTGKELGTPNEIAFDDGHAGGRVAAAHELEHLINEVKQGGRRR